MTGDARYPAWNDKYSMQIIVAIGGGSWREFFKFKEGMNANGFHTSLEYLGDLYTGNGASKREALYSAAFNLIASIQFPETYVREKALDILGSSKLATAFNSFSELANGLGAGIKIELIREEKSKNGHVAIYQSDPKITGEIAGDKRTAKKNLIFKLLQVSQRKISAWIILSHCGKVLKRRKRAKGSQRSRELRFAQKTSQTREKGN